MFCGICDTPKLSTEADTAAAAATAATATADVARAETPVFKGEVPSSFYSQYLRFSRPNEVLDCAIYWYSHDKRSVCKRIDAPDLMKTPEFFNPSKPSLILCHGWIPNAVKNKFRQTFDFRNDIIGINQDTNKLLASATEFDLGKTVILENWKDYNIGVFHWEQFSDENDGVDNVIPLSVEPKIWDDSATYKLRNGIYKVDTSVAKMLVVCLAQVNNISQKPIRLLGHSLGGQLLAATLVELKNDNTDYSVAGECVFGIKNGTLSLDRKSNILSHINRPVFLDAFFTIKEMTEKREKIVASILGSKAGEYYKSSILSMAGLYDPVQIKKECFYAEYNPDFFAITDFRGRHGASMWIYLLQKSFRLTYNSKLFGAQATDEEIISARNSLRKTWWFGRNRYLVQTEGEKSKNLSDHRFDARPYLR